MPNTRVFKGWEICTRTCAFLNNFCVQLQENYPSSRRITYGFCTARTASPRISVRKSGEKAPGLQLVSHNQSPTFWAKITDMYTTLSPLYTGPITTTTNIFNK